MKGLGDISRGCIYPKAPGRYYSWVLGPNVGIISRVSPRATLPPPNGEAPTLTPGRVYSDRRSSAQMLCAVSFQRPFHTRWLLFNHEISATFSEDVVTYDTLRAVVELRYWLV